MIREKIISLLTLMVGPDWVNALIKFIGSDGAKLLSNKPGRYNVRDLLAELNVRAKTAESAGINFVGMIELQDVLATLCEDLIVRNYIFKSASQVAIVYLDDDVEKVIGAVLVKVAKDSEK